MAKKNGSKNGSSNVAKPEEAFKVPEGFDVDLGGQRGEGWLAKVEGNEVTARLLNRREYKSGRKTRAFYQVELLAPCKIQIENPDYNEEADEDEANVPYLIVKGEQGQIINVDEVKQLEALREPVSNGGVYDVWFVIDQKIELDGGNTMWKIQGPRLRVVKQPTRSTGVRDSY